MKKYFLILLFLFMASCGKTEIISQQNSSEETPSETTNIQKEELVDQKGDDKNNTVLDQLEESEIQQIDQDGDTQNSVGDKSKEIDNEQNGEITNVPNLDENNITDEQKDSISENQESENFDILEEISQDYLKNSNFEKDLVTKLYTIGKYTFSGDTYTHKITQEVCIDKFCFISGTPVNIKNNGIIFTPTSEFPEIWFQPSTGNYTRANQTNGPGVKTKHSQFTYENVQFNATTSSSCGGVNYKQTANGTLKSVPKIISYGNVDFYLDDLNFTGKTTLMENLGTARLGFGQDLVKQDATNNTVSISNLQEKLAEKIEKKNKLQTTYYVYLLDYPGVVFPYTTKKELSFGVYKSENNLSDGAVTDLEIAKKIFQKMGQNYVLSHLENGTIPEPSDEILTQIFRVEQVKEDRYLVYLNDKYSLQSMAEMCKPLVYIYGKDAPSMSLELDTIKDSQFTKLIPEFQKENTWNFSTKNNKIYFENESYDYLYYAIKVPNYTHNQYGWVIEGSQAEKFFDEKLAYIGFNQQEKKDFIEYWNPKYETDKYYFVSFKFNQQLDEFVKLQFSEEPNSVFRVLLDSYQIGDKHEISSDYWYENTGNEFDKQLLEKYMRTGKFDVFEWGGVLQTFDKKYIK